MPREVKFLAIAREFRGNGNLNPETESILFPLYDFDLRATHARKLLPAALASVSFGFVLVRVRVPTNRVERLRFPFPRNFRAMAKNFTSRGISAGFRGNSVPWS